MFQSSGGGGDVPASFNLPSFNQEAVRHILLGEYGAIIDAINRMALLGYCERLAWSKPLPTGRNGEYISVMTRKRTIRAPTIPIVFRIIDACLVDINPLVSLELR